MDPININFKHKNTFPWRLALIFLLFTIGIVILGISFYLSQRTRIYSENQRNLEAISSLKIGQVEQWHNERLADAATIKNNEPLVNCINQYFRDSNAPGIKAELLNWLKSVCNEYDYSNVLIIDTERKVRLTVSPSDSAAGDKIGDEIETVLHNKEIFMTDLHKSNYVRYVHLDLLIPLIDFRSKDPIAFGIMILRIDPAKKLFPLLQSWPTASKSAETLIVRKEGDSVLYLNELRHRKNTAMNLRFPLTEKNLPAAKAVNGFVGVVEGADYRNMPVVGYVSVIPGLNWFMVAKIDKEEIVAPLKRFSFISVILTVLLILFNASIFGFWIWNQQVKLYRNQLKNEKAIKESEEKFNIAFRMSPVSVTISLIADNKFIDVNNTFLEDIEYTREEVIGKTARELDLWANEEERQWVIDEIREKGEIFGKVLSYKSKSGRLIYGLSSMSVVKVNGQACNLSTVVNVTESIKSDEKVKQQYYTLKGIIESSRGPIFSLDTNYCYTSFNQVHSQVMKFLYGCDIQMGKSMLEYQSNEEDRKSAKVNIDRALTGEFVEENAWSGPDNETKRFFEVTHNPIYNENNVVIGVAVNARDLTERKRIEEKLIESEELFSKLFQNMLNGFAYCKMIYEEGQPSDFIYITVNEAFGSLTGLKNVEGKKASEAIPGIRESDSELLKKYGRVASTGNPEVFETYVESMKMWFSISVYSPQKEYFVAVFDVITKRKISEEQLRETNEYLSNLFNYANAPIIVWDNSLLITQFNHAFERLSGYFEEEVLGKKIDILFSEEKSESSLELIERAIKGERWETVEIEIQRKDGYSRIVLWNSANILDKDGKTVVATIAQGHDITERKRAEEELKGSENKFRQTFDFSPVGIVMTGLDKSFIRCNNAFSRALGYLPDELIGKTFTEITHPDDRLIGITDMGAMLRGEIQSVSVQKRYLRKEGQIVWAEVLISLMRDTNGNPQYFLSIIQDITQRKKSEEALFESEDKFKYVFDHSVIGKSITLPTGEINVNKAFCEMTGYTSEELNNKRWQEISHPGDIQITNDALNLLISGKKDSVRLIKRYINKNGSLIWADVGTTLRRDMDGKPLYFMTAVLDITERKLAEESLRESERRLREAQEMAHLGFWFWDIKTGFVEWSEEVYKIFWLDPEKFTPQIDSILALSPWEEDNQRDKELINRAITSHTPGSYEQKFLRPDKSIGHYYSTFQGNYDENGDVISIVGTVLDITDRKIAESQIKMLNEELEQRVIQRTEQLEAANKELEAFSYSVSHDLRSPLRAVHSYTNILLEEYEKTLDEEGKRLCGIISSSATQMGELIDDLLSFSRIGRSTMNPSKLDMKSIAGSVFDEISSEKERTRIKFHVGKLHKCFGDPGLIKLVWNNLISNSIKYSSKETVSEIVISSILEENRITYSVKDNGVGFDMKYKHKLFGVFQRLHSESEFEGNGVGLAIVQRIIFRHGGAVWAEGEVGKGATFYFSLPANGEDKRQKTKVSGN
jgi:PAS domain S-box-containing protein